MISVRNPKLINFILFIGIIGFLSSSCAHSDKVPFHNIKLPEIKNKIDISIELILSDEFRNFKYEEKIMGSTFTIGENLVHHTKNLTENVFRNSLFYDEKESKDASMTAGGYLLEPKIVFMEKALSMSAFSEAKTTIGIEWKLLRRRTGEPVWIETIQGVGIGPMGTGYSHNEKAKERIQKALQDLFRKSQDAMLSSAVLRKLQ